MMWPGIMGKQGPIIIHHAGYWQEWFRRRGEWVCNVYKMTADPDGGHTRYGLVAELTYPKIGTPEDFKDEASRIAAGKEAS